MSDEQYIDELFAREDVGMDTPGFRDFVLNLMGMIGEQPRAGDVCSMHLAYRAGMEQSQAPNWTPDRPTKPGEYWLSLHPSMRASLAKELRMTPPSVLKVQLDRGSILTEFWWGDNAIEDEFLDGALWAPRETPADPFEEVGT